MLEVASLLALYLAFALVHAAHPRRFPARRWHPTRAWLGAMRAFAAASAISGVVLWAQVQGVVAALLVALAALCVIGALFVLLAPLSPRTLWSLALACPLLIVSFTLAGVVHD